jgi:integrase
VNCPDGTRKRISGTPNSGRFRDLAPTKAGAKEAERRAIAEALGARQPAKRAAPDEKPTEPKKKEVPTLSEYVKPFLENYAASHKPSSRREKRQRLNADIVPSLGHLRLDEIRQEDVDGLVARLLRRGLDRKTVNNVTAVLSSLLRYAKRNKVIESMDLSFMIKVQRSRLVAVAPEDVDLLLGATEDPRYRAAILLAADAGLRVGEIRALTWSEVNELGRELTIARSIDRSNELTETKGWDCRTVPISDRLWAALAALERGRWAITRRGNSEKPLGYDTMREAIRRAYEKAKVEIPPKPWHCLRHSFGTQLANAGVPIHVIKELMGHRSIETTLRYMHTDRQAKRDAISALRGSSVAAEARLKRTNPASD